MSSIPVIAAPHFDPGRRQQMVAAPGETIAEIVARALPNLPAAHRGWVKVYISGVEILSETWARVKPKLGSNVFIRVCPAGDNLRSILSIVVAVAAIAVGQFYLGPAIASGLSLAAGSAGATFVTGASVAALTVAGNLLINALVPIRPPSQSKQEDDYAISGMQNRAVPDGPVPVLMGQLRFAPYHAALPYTEVVSDDMYIRALFVVGYGPMSIPIDEIKIGETPISKYDEVEIEVREGYPTDTPVTLYPRQVIEERLNVALEQENSATQRFTPSDVTECSWDVTFPSGLIEFNDEGEEGYTSVVIDFRYRKVGTDAWLQSGGHSFGDSKRDAVMRSVTIQFPERGRYELEWTRTTPKASSNKELDASFLTAVRSVRPEYPINFKKPLAIIAVRIRATAQLNGALEQMNCLATSICPDYDTATGTWITRATRNPASLFRYALQGPFNPFPVPDAGIDLAALADWHDYCRVKGLEYNRLHDFDQSLWEGLQDIAAAGRAAPWDRGDQWSVIIDRPQTLAVHAISPTNSWGFQGKRAFRQLPDAWRIKFNDETNGYAPGEMIVPRPGFVGDPVLSEEISLPGVTKPEQVWKEGKRRWREIEFRPDTYTAQQDIERLNVARGDLAYLSHDVISRHQKAARVIATDDTHNFVFLSDTVTMEAGKSYACRFRNKNGSFFLRNVQTVPGETDTLNLIPGGALPEENALALFGEAGVETLEVVVKSIETTDDFGALLTFVDHAPQIEALADAEVMPLWSGRVGQVTTVGEAVPSVPAIRTILSGSLGGGFGDAEVIFTVNGSAPVGSVEARHRVVGTGTWTGTATAPAGSGAVSITGPYAKGTNIEAQVRAISPGSGQASDWSASTTHVIGAADPDVPSGVVLSFSRVTTGGQVTRIDAAITAAPSSASGSVLVGQYKQTSASVWSADIRAGSDGAVRMTGLNDGVSYDFRVAWLRAGIFTPWYTIARVPVASNPASIGEVLTSWTASAGLTVTAVTGAGPWGANAYDLTDTDASRRYLEKTLAVANDTASHTLQFAVQAGTGSAPAMRASLAFEGGTGISSIVFFNPNTGIVTSGVATVEDLGGWYRVTIPYANNGSGNTLARARLMPVEASASTGTNRFSHVTLA